MIPIIEEAALRKVITPQVAVAAMREAFRADGEGRAHVPAVINLEVPAHRGEFHVKTALIDGVPHVAVKIASGFYGNPAKHFTHRAMRGPSGWSVGDRELMAAVVSQANECAFCVGAHTATAQQAYADPAVKCRTASATESRCSG